MHHSHPCAWRCAKRARLKKCHGYQMRPGGHAWGGPEDEMFEGGGGFGVRRPLRFLSRQLNLDDAQVAGLMRILDELKTEWAQAAVDQRRTVTAFADALAGAEFDAAKAAEGGDLRVKSAERLREVVVRALQQIHAILKAEQRERLAFLIRAGRLAL